MQNPSVFELNFFGILDHFMESDKSVDVDVEDKFVHRLRRLGGTFSEYQYGFRQYETLYDEIHTWLGWPEDEEHRDGVWVLRMKKEETCGRMTGRIRLATTMQDRCRAIEMCGGIFHAIPTNEHLVPMEPRPRYNSHEQEIGMEAEFRFQS